ncbi:MAG: nuclear transport factor 2 family protein [Rhodothermales bacterium]
MLRRLLLPALALALLPTAAHAQTPEAAAVMAPIHRLFDGMRAADTTMMRSAFHDGSTLLSVGLDREGTVTVRETPIDQFMTGVAQPHDEVYDERLGEPEIRIDGDLATVWVPYGFYLGDTFSHCGVNAFQLARLHGDWVIIHTADSRRRDNCDPAVAP